jgi:hypothetical protein
MAKDKRFIAIAPFLVFFRNISIGIGILAGLARIR